MKHSIFKLAMLALCASAFAACNKEADQKQYDDPTGGDATKIWGHIDYDDGAPATGVTVSNGYDVTTVDKNGCFILPVNSDAYYVYFSFPSDAKITTGGNYNLPYFYQRITSGKREYGFTLTRQSVETNFRLIGIGDPQVTDSDEVGYFRNETVADMKAFVTANSTLPTYGITLGDNVGNEWGLFSQIGRAMDASVSSFPIFPTIGNHDHEFNKSDESEAQYYTNASTYYMCPKGNLASQRKYELNFGPVNYSFNRGNIHIMSIDDIMHTGYASANYAGGFYDWQWEWIQKDIEYMPEGYIPVLCLHMPFKDSFTNFTDKTKSHYNDVLNLIAKYKGFVIAGHQHNHRFYDHAMTAGTVHEYVLGTACGAWWHGRICTDGAPNGFCIFEFNGTSLVNEHYKGTDLDAGFQVRMHKPSSSDEFTWDGGTWTKTFKWLSTAANAVILNVWDIDDGWTIEVYEDGTLTQTLKGTDKKTGYDVWAKNWFYRGGGGIKTSSNYSNMYNHMFLINLKNASAKVKIVAKDEYGNTYTQEEFQDYNKYPWK